MRTATTATTDTAGTLWRCGGRQCGAGECEHEEGELHRHASGPGPEHAPPIVHEVLASAGSPLQAGVRSDMERRFAHRFGDVRVHVDARAAESARAVNADAFTVGRHIVFGAGQFRPWTSRGALVLAHELAHVSHDGATTTPGGRIRVGSRRDAAEVRAHSTAARVMSGPPTRSPESDPVHRGSASSTGADTLRRFDTEDCSESQTDDLRAALPVARAMVNKAIRVLGQARTPEVDALMRKYFIEASTSTQLHALIGYTALKRGIDGAFTFECEDSCDNAYAYVYAIWSDVHMCPQAFGRSTNELARTIVHESSHKFDDTDDEEYCYTGCHSIDRWDAYDNADSYARFAWEAYTTL
jgi:hypothetical protein